MWASCGYFLTGCLYLSGQYMARVVVKNILTPKSHVLQWHWLKFMCCKHEQHSRLKKGTQLGGPMWSFKEKYDIYIWPPVTSTLNSKFETWNDNVSNMQLLTWWSIFWLDSMDHVACGGGHAHNKATYQVIWKLVWQSMTIHNIIKTHSNVLWDWQ